jgi:hypothetical protein
MSENNSLTVVGFATLAIALAMTAALSLHFGHIPGHTALEEVFAAAVDVFFEVCVAGGVIWWYQRRQALRVAQEAIVHDLVDIRTQVAAAGFLVSSHRSGLTWGQQLRILIAAIARIDEVDRSIKELGDRAHSTKALGHLRHARSALEELRSEYRDQHEAVDRDQTVFEKAKKDDQMPDLDAHWRKMLSYLKKTETLVIDEPSQLLLELRKAADSVSGHRETASAAAKQN